MLSKLVVWLREQKGVLLVFVWSLISLWLATHGQLKLYIHPRYEFMTAVFAFFGLGGSILALTRGSGHRFKPIFKWRSLVIGAVVLILTILTVLLPARTLTVATATSRGVGQATKLEEPEPSLIDQVSNDYTRFNIKDWAALLSATQDPSYFAQKKAHLSGFVSPSGKADLFYISRFAITCCAVDAQPLGIPVLLANWQQQYRAGQWVEITGSFSNQSGSLALTPETVKLIEEPHDPYVY
jgi:putative membrane protein